MSNPVTVCGTCGLWHMRSVRERMMADSQLHGGGLEAPDKRNGWQGDGASPWLTQCTDLAECILDSARRVLGKLDTRGLWPLRRHPRRPRVLLEHPYHVICALLQVCMPISACTRSTLALRSCLLHPPPSSPPFNEQRIRGYFDRLGLLKRCRDAESELAHTNTHILTYPSPHSHRPAPCQVARNRRPRAVDGFQVAPVPCGQLANQPSAQSLAPGCCDAGRGQLAYSRVAPPGQITGTGDGSCRGAGLESSCAPNQP